MKTKFEVAKINNKEYTTLSGFKKGLKAKNCPFEVNDDGLFADFAGKLKSRQWNYAGQKFSATVQLSE